MTNKRRILYLFALIFSLILFSGWLYLRYAPAFGAYADALPPGKFEKSLQYRELRFINPFPLPPMERKGFGESMKKMLFGEGGEPLAPLPASFGSNLSDKSDRTNSLTWFGHSAFLLELEGKRILIDPMLTDKASPLPIGPTRFPTTEKIPLEKIRDIDAIILSHDHYDHLDYKSILTLKEHTGHFFTALGVGEHLKRWGIPAEKITELDWWETASLDSLQFTATPAQHFSGRRTNNRNTTLWASWVIAGRQYRIFFSGDGGYNQHFAEIGQKLGPFDLAMVECGQYNPAWKDMHMMPEESVQAGEDLRAAMLMPIHWGGFKLSIHTWKDPIERFMRAAEQRGIPYIHPRIGNPVVLEKAEAGDRWWEGIE